MKLLLDINVILDVARARDRKAAALAVADLLDIADVVEVGAADFRRALLLDLPDFEDAVQASCALKMGAEAIVTRDAAGFAGLDLPVLTPGAAL